MAAVHIRNPSRGARRVVALVAILACAVAAAASWARGERFVYSSEPAGAIEEPAEERPLADLAD